MKRALLASILGLAASVATSFGQGTIQFNNYQSTVYNQMKYAVNAALGGLSGQAANSPTIKVQLFWALGVVADPNVVDDNAGVTTFVNPLFTFGGGGYYNGPNQSIPTFAVNGGGQVTFMVRAWETAGPNGGATFDLSQLKGQSGLWQEVQATPGGNGIAVGSDPVGFFFSGPPTLTLNLVPVPEPSTFALAGLGLGSLLVMVRRRK